VEELEELVIEIAVVEAVIYGSVAPFSAAI
jgi:hypothetical protein